MVVGEDGPMRGWRRPSRSRRDLGRLRTQLENLLERILVDLGEAARSTFGSLAGPTREEDWS